MSHRRLALAALVGLLGVHLAAVAQAPPPPSAAAASAAASTGGTPSRAPSEKPASVAAPAGKPPSPALSGKPAPPPAPPASTPPPAPGKPSTEDRLNALALAIDEQTRASHWEAAEAIVREMAAIDPNHPKAYFRAVTLERDRRQPEKAPLLMDTLGPKDGPGRACGDALIAFFGGQLDAASAGFTAALAKYEELGHTAGQAACHTALGNIARRISKYEEAAQQYDAATGLLEKLGDRAGLADMLVARADALLGGDRPAEGADAAGKAADIRSAIGGPRDVARALNVLGRCQRAMGRPQDALVSYNRALELTQQAQDRPGEAAMETEIALIHQDAGEFAAALDHEKRALAIAEGLNDKRELARQHRILADLLVAAGRPREAVPLFEKAATLYGEQNMLSSEGRALNALGEAWTELGELRRARRAFEPALAKSRGAHDRAAEANAHTGLGNLAISSGDLARGLLFEEEALSIYREVKDARGELSCLNNLGAAYFRLGDRLQARRYVDLALSAAKESSRRPAEAQARNNLAVLLAAEGSYAAALEEARRSETLWKEIGNAQKSATSGTNAAEMLLRLGRLNEVRPLVDAALAAFRGSGDMDGQAYAQNLLGELRLAQGSRQGALSAHRRALALASEADSPEELWRARAGLAAALEADGARREAFAEMLAALDEVERVRTRLVTGELKMRFLAERIDLYEKALGLALPAHSVGNGQRSSWSPNPRDVAAAFAIVERSRARSLLDALAFPDVPSSTTAPSEIDSRRLEARDTLGEALARLARAGSHASRAAARRDVEKASAVLERMEIQIRADSERSGGPGPLPEARPVTLARVQQSVLHENEGLLEYFLGESGAWVFSITKRRASVRSLVPPREIAAKAASFLDATAGAGKSAWDHDAMRREREAAETLAAVLLPAGLPEGSRLLVAPDGPLRHVPFEAIRTGGRFLVETREVAVVPSAATLALLREPRKRVRNTPGRSPAGFLGVADPSLGVGGVTIPPLPFARREVEGIAALFPQSESKVLVGEDATRSKVLSAAPGRRFVHFATHAWLDTENPRDTGLRLGAEKPGEGGALLGVADILSLSLSADLVVVSACSSGEGEALRGEGLAGLTRAFLYAGSRAVVVSLWDVPDRSTADFMQDFYEGLVHGQDATAALRASKLRFLASDVPGRDRILNWAPFILVGDPGMTTSRSNHTGAQATQ